MTQRMTEPLSLDMLLRLSCANYEDFNDYEEAKKLYDEGKEDPRYDSDASYFRYLGWNRYSIVLHCIEATVIARLRKDNTYEIREWFIRDH